MVVQSIQPVTREIPGAVSRSPERGTAVTSSGTPPVDRVNLSEQGRAMSALLATQEGPELQLSPKRLREMLEQVTPKQG